MKKSIFILTFLLLFIGLSNANEFGQHVGVIKSEWLNDGRKMKLLEDYHYIDPYGISWIAPKDSIIDGASIPQAAWSLIGGPYEGKYRNASVIHDVACKKKDRDWSKVHEAFYYAMRAYGVEELKAKTMYGAVYHLGPRWKIVMTKSTDKEMSTAYVDSIKKQFPDSSFEVSSEPEYTVMQGVQKDFKFPTGLEIVSVIVKPPSQTLNEVGFKKLREEIEEKNLTLDQIRNYRKNME